MDGEAWRWAIGGVLGALIVGVGYLVRMAYSLGGTLTRIDDRLGFHGERHDDHATSFAAQDQRLRELEQWRWKHSGETAATMHAAATDTTMRGGLR